MPGRISPFFDFQIRVKSKQFVGTGGYFLPDAKVEQDKIPDLSSSPAFDWAILRVSLI